MAQQGNVTINMIAATASDVVTQVRTQELRGELVLLYPVTNWIAALTDIVIRIAGRPANVGVLRFWGHGYLSPHPGGVAVMFSDPAGTGSFNPDTMVQPHVKAAVPRLKPYFAPGARVEFKHCRVATPAGRGWLKQLSDDWAVEVHATESTQSLVPWTGPVWSFKPGRGPMPITGIDPK